VAATVTVADGRLVVTGLGASPRLELFFRAVLGGTQGQNGWIISPRGSSLEELVVRVVGQLQKEGIETHVAGGADRALELASDRARSYGRARDAAISFKAGTPVITMEDVRVSLESMGWDFASRDPRPHQQSAALHALSAVNAANFSVPGSGKTAATLSVLAVHLNSETVDGAIVVGPLASFGPWETEAAAALPRSVRVLRVRGPRSARRAIYDSTQCGDILLVTYPTVPADIRALRALADRLSMMLVVDESHRIKRFRGGQWAEAIKDLARSCCARMILTGTPMPQGPEDLYSQLQVLWPDGQLTGSRLQFQNRASTDFAGLVEHVSPFFVRTGKDALGIPPYSIVTHDVDMRELQTEVYDLIVARFRRSLADADLWQDKITLLRKARPLRLIQAASNPDLLNADDGYFKLPAIDTPGATLLTRLLEYRAREIPAKFAAALEIVREKAAADRKVVVWTSFIRNIDQFSHLVRTELGIPTWSVDGRVPAAVQNDNLRPDDPSEEIDVTREQRIRSFLGQAGPAVLVANPAACGESISLHMGCETAVYLDRTYDCARYLQSIDRIHRLGLSPDAKVEIHLLNATRGGAPAADQLVHQALVRKQSRMEAVLEGAELRPANLPDEAGEAEAAEGDRKDLEDILAYLLGK